MENKYINSKLIKNIQKQNIEKLQKIQKQINQKQKEIQELTREGITLQGELRLIKELNKMEVKK